MNTDKLREFCLSLPGVAESIKWEDHLCFTVGEKIFCIAGFTDASHVSIKTGDEDFGLLTERNGIIPAPYLARNKWVAVTRRSALTPAEWRHYILRSYDLVKEKLPKKIRMGIDATGKG